MPLNLDEKIKSMHADLNEHFNSESTDKLLKVFIADFCRGAESEISTTDDQALKLQSLSFSDSTSNLKLESIITKIQAQFNLPSKSHVKNILKFFSQATSHRYLYKIIVTECLAIWGESKIPSINDQLQESYLQESYQAQIINEKCAIITISLRIPKLHLRDNSCLFCPNPSENTTSLEFEINLATGHIEKINKLHVLRLESYLPIIAPPPSLISIAGQKLHTHVITPLCALYRFTGLKTPDLGITQKVTSFVSRNFYNNTT